MIITPISAIHDERGEKSKTIKIGNGEFKEMTKLYDIVRAIQFGEMEDEFKWLSKVDC